MLKQKALLGLLGLFLFVFCGCTDEVEQVSENARGVIMTAADFEYGPESRTDIVVGPNGGKFTWAKGDTVGIFPDKGFQVAFPINEGAGSNTAKFTGGGWALKPSSKYMAYYPMQGDFYLNKTDIPINFAGQVQTGDNSTAHLGKFDYMVSQATTPDNGAVNFRFSHLTALVKLTIKLPEKAPLSSVTFNANAPVFTVKGDVNLTSANPMITSKSKSKVVSIGVDNIRTAQKSTYTLYFMIAPVDLRGKSLKVVAINEKGSYSGTFTGRELLAGHVYALEVELPEIVNDFWVDMGLSVKWASHNVGAGRPEQYGDYFAWGETQTKSSYTEQNSLNHNQVMDNIEGNPAFDAARANWGEPSRLPTVEEFDELKNNTTQKWEQSNGVWGHRLTSKINGKSIFFPAAGFRGNGSASIEDGKFGNYWTSISNGSKKAYMIHLNQGGIGISSNLRYYGYSIRPVMKKEK